MLKESQLLLTLIIGVVSRIFPSSFERAIVHSSLKKPSLDLSNRRLYGLGIYLILPGLAHATGSVTSYALYTLWKKRTLKSGRKSLDGFDQIEPTKILLVHNTEEWESAYKYLKDAILLSKVLGFDCEWSNHDGKPRPVALLQLATLSGLCVLVQINTLFKSGLPSSLSDILADRSILKVGVASLDDARKLERDYGICCLGCVDLRNLALRFRISIDGSGGLKSLAASVLNVNLNKSFGIRCSNWEADELTPEQQLYAACDALAAVLVFQALINQKRSTKIGELKNIELTSSEISCMCQGIIDSPFKSKSEKNDKQKSVNAGSRRPFSDSGKEARAYVVRKSPLYHNCRLLSSDNQILCTCDVKKANWYLEKGLGEKVEDDPFTVRLLFEPAGRPKNEFNYYLQEKNNVCVVCGAAESFIRKNVIPHEYRKHFPAILKEHKSHDIVLMCTRCHMRSNFNDNTLKQQLAIECNAQLTSAKYRQDHNVTKVKSAARALRGNTDHIPPSRIKELERILLDYYCVSELDDGLLQKALDSDARCQNHDFEEHGLKVVQHALENEGLLAFERLWRQNFLDTMKPAFLPHLWSVDHGHEELMSLDSNMKQAIDGEKEDDVGKTFEL